VAGGAKEELVLPVQDEPRAGPAVEAIHDRVGRFEQQRERVRVVAELAVAHATQVLRRRRRIGEVPAGACPRL
jgi:hypothetical protein